MTDIRIGNAVLSVEGIRPLKSDVKVDGNLAHQLSRDGFDEVIFKKGDQLFIAYQKNMDLDKLKLNVSDAHFDVNSAYDAGQMSVDGDAVQVLLVDDENKDSLWVAPFKSAGRAVTSLVNHPFGKSALLSFAAGAAMGTVNMFEPKEAILNSTILGTAGGSVVAGLKAAEEHNQPNFWDTGAALGLNAVSYLGGALTGSGAKLLGEAIIQNPKTAALSAGIAAVVVGTGIILDKVSDNNKPATYRVINQISAR